MFSNCYQPPLFEIYNSKEAKNSHGNRDKQKHYSKLIDLNNSVYEYDNCLKTYLLTSKQIKLPYGKDTELALVHPIIGIQGFFTDKIHLELYIVDTKQTRRRLIFNSLKKEEIKPFYIATPLQNQSIYNNWITLLIDIPSFLNSFKCTTYRSLEQILISSQSKIRRIFMLQSYNENLLSQINYPLEADSKSFFIKYQEGEKELFINNELQQKKDKENIIIEKQIKSNTNIKKQQSNLIISQKKKPQILNKNIENQQYLNNQNIIQDKNNLIIIDNEFLEDNNENNKIQIHNNEEDLKAIDFIIEKIEQEKNQIKELPTQNEENDICNIIETINKIENNNSQTQNQFNLEISNPTGCTTLTKLGEKTYIIENRIEQQNFVQLIFDPILNCYFNPKNNKCYV